MVNKLLLQLFRNLDNVCKGPNQRQHLLQADDDDDDDMVDNILGGIDSGTHRTTCIP